MIQTDDLDRAVAAIGDAESVALACHVGPDGDALGSMLALHHLCRAHGVTSIASFPEPFIVAPHYLFLPGLDTLTKPADFPDAPELMITFDCGSVDRLGSLAPAARAAGELIVLDHHLSNDCYGTINLVDTDAAATAVVVRQLAHLLGWPLNRDAALCIYTGLVTDTGRFQYSNTTPEVFRLAEELSTFDLPIADMTRQLFEEHRFAYLQLMAACLNRAALDTDLAFVATWITSDDLETFGVEMEETEGMIDLVRRAAEAEVACILKETPEGIRVSLRSISRVDVAAVATGFGGGGHRYAAGFTTGGTVESVLEDIKAAVRGVTRRVSDTT
ncbi:MAG TPA: bifunctional oligoribonuclease/PAP phosphatase NrnA [Acidimicrobiales bacterium]|nr:bifunctional oligoribonuclease/PAP phosphatase NrnA [Acidimicrobiales bacterium]